MIKTNKKYAECERYTDCSHAAPKKATEKVDLGYSFYSKVLRMPFDSLSELTAAEAAYYNELKAKEDKAAKKKADAQKVEDAFKALNAARKTYKEDLAQLTKEYAESLENLKKAFDLGKKDIHNTLAIAEDDYKKALKEFTEAHPEGYHVTLRDGDFETTISKQTSGDIKPSADLTTLADLFNAMFNF